MLRQEVCVLTRLLTFLEQPRTVTLYESWENYTNGYRKHFRDFGRLSIVLPNLEENVKCYCQGFVPGTP